MPRQARIDAPGALHHVIIRGIENKAIFTDAKDYQNFLNRLGLILTETETPCFAWALMNNLPSNLTAGINVMVTYFRTAINRFCVSRILISWSWSDIFTLIRFALVLSMV
jgi:hypothetical protein